MFVQNAAYYNSYRGLWSCCYPGPYSGEDPYSGSAEMSNRLGLELGEEGHLTLWNCSKEILEEFEFDFLEFVSLS